MIWRRGWKGKATLIRSPNNGIRSLPRLRHWYIYRSSEGDLCEGPSWPSRILLTCPKGLPGAKVPRCPGKTLLQSTKYNKSSLPLHPHTIMMISPSPAFTTGWWSD